MPPAKANLAASQRTTSAAASVPFRTVLFSMVVLWAAYFLIVTVRSYVAGFDMQIELAWRRGLVTLSGLALTIVLWSLLRLFDTRPLWVKISAALVLALPVALAIGQINQLVFEEMQLKWEKRFEKMNNIGLRRDEAGNLLVDVPVRPGAAAAEGPSSDASTAQPGTTQSGTTQPGTAETESILIRPAATNADRWRSVLDIALGRYFLLLAWASLYFALLAGYQAREAQRREEQFRSAAKAAELRSLRYQVNPHFLFNTLNSLSALVMTGKPQRAEEMIQSISRFYRHSLADDPTSDVMLADEFDMQREYLEIEAVRFPDRLRTRFDLPPELADARVPGMILQPLVENSVKYAVSPVARAVTITLAAREEFDRLVLSVSDDGPGVPAGVEHGFGIGLANVRDRLEARFGTDVVLTSTPHEGGYVTEMRIPLTRQPMTAYGTEQNDEAYG
ncbi:MAG: histidine kinase [Erythrobacter sp.]|uniref:sensor histidine kinase n=1 Tax=Erythrobacter sp. TaxID=1042 RepID=UPI002619B4A8|nr:histidine kinase [Erythrobacter sp.]MDJ0978498.1 histidine kinase [Erythrobacter sp.]